MPYPETRTAFLFGAKLAAGPGGPQSPQDAARIDQNLQNIFGDRWKAQAEAEKAQAAEKARWEDRPNQPTVANPTTSSVGSHTQAPQPSTGGLSQHNPWENRPNQPSQPHNVGVDGPAPPSAPMAAAATGLAQSPAGTMLKQVLPAFRSQPPAQQAQQPAGQGPPARPGAAPPLHGPVHQPMQAMQGPQATAPAPQGGQSANQPTPQAPAPAAKPSMFPGSTIIGKRTPQPERVIIGKRTPQPPAAKPALKPYQTERGRGGTETMQQAQTLKKPPTPGFGATVNKAMGKPAPKPLPGGAAGVGQAMMGKPPATKVGAWAAKLAAGPTHPEHGRPYGESIDIGKGLATSQRYVGPGRNMVAARNNPNLLGTWMGDVNTIEGPARLRPTASVAHPSTSSVGSHTPATKPKPKKPTVKKPTTSSVGSHSYSSKKSDLQPPVNPQVPAQAVPPVQAQPAPPTAPQLAMAGPPSLAYPNGTMNAKDLKDARKTAQMSKVSLDRLIHGEPERSEFLSDMDNTMEFSSLKQALEGIAGVGPGGLLPAKEAAFESVLGDLRGVDGDGYVEAWKDQLMDIVKRATAAPMAGDPDMSGLGLQMSDLGPQPNMLSGGLDGQRPEPTMGIQSNTMQAAPIPAPVGVANAETSMPAPPATTPPPATPATPQPTDINNLENAMPQTQTNQMMPTLPAMGGGAIGGPGAPGGGGGAIGPGMPGPGQGVIENNGMSGMIGGASGVGAGGGMGGSAKTALDITKWAASLPEPTILPQKTETAANTQPKPAPGSKAMGSLAAMVAA